MKSGALLGDQDLGRRSLRVPEEAIFAVLGQEMDRVKKNSA
jgi:hypothetical protein